MSSTATQDDVVDLIAPLRRYVGAHVRQDDVDDVVQETLLRVLTARNRLEPAAALAYGLVVARNVIIDRGTRDRRARLARPRLIDLTTPGTPDETVIWIEEREAVRSALMELPDGQREVFMAHVLDDEPVTALADRAGASSGSVGASLARTRARLRLDYVLALRGVELPTQRCRPVMLAVSAADSRRQKVLRAGHHLLACSVCSSLAEPLMRRRSALAVLLPWLSLGPAIAVLRRAARANPGTTAVTGTALASAGLVVAVQTLGSQPPPPRPAATAPAAIVRQSDSRPLLDGGVPLTSLAGQKVRGSSVDVADVDGDEGFWVMDNGGPRIWVQLSEVGKESPFTVHADDKVSFLATVKTHDAQFARTAGVSAEEGADLLSRQGAHLTVREQDLKVEPS